MDMDSSSVSTVGRSDVGDFGEGDSFNRCCVRAGVAAEKSTFVSAGEAFVESEGEEMRCLLDRAD
jgi:hypothetical protein